MENERHEKQGAIFLDRDGVINENPEFYVKSWDEFHFFPGTLKALHDLAEFPWPILIITNQSAVGRGIISQEALEEIHAQMLEKIRAAGGRIDGIYVCPHVPDAGCQCRKPQPGLLLQAAQDWNLDLEGSLMIGDSLSDFQVAQSVSMHSILINPDRTEHHLMKTDGLARFDLLEPITRLDLVVEQLIVRYRSHTKIERPVDMVYFASQGEFVQPGKTLE